MKQPDSFGPFSATIQTRTLTDPASLRVDASRFRAREGGFRFANVLLALEVVTVDKMPPVIGGITFDTKLVYIASAFQWSVETIHAKIRIRGVGPVNGSTLAQEYV